MDNYGKIPRIYDMYNHVHIIVRTYIYIYMYVWYIQLSHCNKCISDISWIMNHACGTLQTPAMLRSSPLLRHVEWCQMAGCCTAASRLLDKSWCVWKWCLQCIPTCPNGHWNREHDDNPVESGVAYWRLTQLWRAIFVVAMLWPHWFYILLFGKLHNAIFRASPTERNWNQIQLAEEDISTWLILRVSGCFIIYCT